MADEMSKMSSLARLKLLTYLGYLILLTIYVLCLVMTSHVHAAPTCPRNVGINKVGFCLSNRSFYEWECIQCPHGLGQSIQCGRIYYELLKVHCVPCENGTSYSNSNDNGQCIKCKKCQENELKSGQCLPDKDTTKCVCKLGYYRDRGHCKPCSWCCGDKSNDHVEECKHLEKKCSYTAKSCDPTTTSAPTTTAKQPRTEESQNKSNPTTFNPNDSEFKSTTKCSEKPKDILLAILVPVSIVFLALLIVYCYKKRRGNSSIFSELKSIKVPLLRLARQLSNDEEKENSIISLNLNTGTAKHVKEGETEQAERNNNPTDQERPLLAEPQGQASQSTNCEDEIEKLEKKELIHKTYGPKVKDMTLDVTHEVCLMLNPIQKIKANDYRKVADNIGLKCFEIKNIGSMDDVFEVMITQAKKVDEFVDILFKIGREDVVSMMYEMATHKQS